MNMVKVKILKKCWCGDAGAIKEMHASRAKQLIDDRFAVEVAEDREAREARNADSLKIRDKAFSKRDKEAEKEAKKEAKKKEAEKAKRSRGRKKPDNKAMSAKE